jgi:hypothetical protein
VAATLASASLLSSSPIWAQPMAGALGKPLESPDLAPGTVSVRIVAGTPSKNVVGTEVTLLVDGTPRIARTGPDGRALFKDVKTGAKLQAIVEDDEKKQIKSDEFALPGVGVKVMLSTLPWNPGASAGGGGPPMAGAAGMPNPRQMSGEPRPEQADPAGTFTVRLTYDDFKDAPPVGVPVALVGYHGDDTIDMQVVNSDAEGRSQFKGLDRSGATSYFALALLPRDGKLERLTSTPAVLDARVGVRLILSGEKRTSNAPIVDDISKYEKQDNAPPAGKLTIALEGGVESTGQVSLVEITPEGNRVFASAKPESAAPDPTQVQAQSDVQNQADVPAHSVGLMVHGGADSTDAPLEGATIMVVPEATADAWQGQVDQTTGADGKALVTLDPSLKGPFVGIITINGKRITTKSFDVAAQGAVIEVEAHWVNEGKSQATFDLVPRPGQVFYAETRMHGLLYRSMPFQPIPDKGTRATIFVYPRILFTFSLTSRVDDKYLAVNGRFEVSNNAWAPYVGGPDGLMIPLPKHFVGGLVAEKDQSDVALVPGEGFRLIRPLPPGSRPFHGAFSLPVEDGAVSWRLDLPFGSFNSFMEMLSVPGMQVQTPPGVSGKTTTIPQGTFYVLPQISIMPKQSMVMSISGLPQQPPWKVWLPRFFGIIVVLLILGGVTAALLSKRSADVDKHARRQKLLDELVELERSQGKGSAKRREQIMAELESLWDAA